MAALAADTEEKNEQEPRPETLRQSRQFLKPLRKVLDARATQLLLNIVSKIIEDPKDVTKQDLNYDKIRSKIDCKAAFEVLTAIGFKEYTSTDGKQQKRAKIEITDNSLAYLEYVYNEILYHSLDRSRAYREHFDCQLLMKSNLPKYISTNKQLVFNTICPNKHDDCFGTLVYARHNALTLPSTMPDPTSFIEKNLTIEPNIYEYVANDKQDASTLHFYVNFADRHLFGYYQTDLFAQDEIMTLEHPILCALAEKAKQSKDINKLTPICERSVIILNALKHGHFGQKAMKKIYGNRFAFTDQKTILQSLEVCKPPIVDNIICMVSMKASRILYTLQHIQYLLQTAYTGFSGARCEALYQCIKHWREPNAVHSIYDCNHEQFMWILEKYVLIEEATNDKVVEKKDVYLAYCHSVQMDGKSFKTMSRKEFGAGLVEYADRKDQEEHGDDYDGKKNKKLNGPSMKVYKALAAFEDMSISETTVSWDGFVATKSEEQEMDNDEQKEPEKKEKNTQRKLKKIVIHTGNWGTGAFGGNLELHAMLQILAAVMAEVDEVCYHAVDEKAMNEVYTACDVLKEEIVPKCKDKKGRIKCDLLFAELMKKKYRWGTPNGT